MRKSGRKERMIAKVTMIPGLQIICNEDAVGMRIEEFKQRLELICLK